MVILNFKKSILTKEKIINLKKILNNVLQNKPDDAQCTQQCSIL